MLALDATDFTFRRLIRNQNTENVEQQELRLLIQDTAGGDPQAFARLYQQTSGWRPGILLNGGTPSG